MNKEEDTAPKFSDLAQLTYRNGLKLDGVVSLLGAIADSNDDIVKYKKEQKEGDIIFRRKSERLGRVTVTISLLALAVSIKGVDYFIGMIEAWL
tara:strand:+ start:5375 stop:5656 length:282 start_codon:yes stop_codon:yes gene_type:complete